MRDQLAIALTYSSLSSAITSANLRGPAGLTGTAAVLVDLAPFNGGTYGASGTLSGTVPLAIPQLLNVIDGNTYFHLETVTNPTGEIRGQLTK